MATDADTCLLSEAVIIPAKKYTKTPAQVVLRWHIQRNTISIPKTIKKERLEENINVFDFELTQEEMKAISALNKNIRYNDPGAFAEAAFGCFYPIYD